MRRPVVIIACCAALAVPASSQPPRPAAVKADVEVNLVVVDVVVTDSNERHIEGLAPEDFELSEDGTLQGITDFSEEGTEPASAAAGAAPAMETGRRFVLFFDESRMTPNQHAHAGRAAAEFLAATIMPADLVSVLTYANAMRLEQDFTGDVEALRKALEKRGHRGAMGPEAYAGQDTISTDPLANPSPGEGARYISPDDDPREKALQGPDVTFQSVAQHARLERLREAERFYQALELVGKTLSRTPGRKTLVLFSAGIETSLGTDKHRYREMVDALNRANVAVYAVDVAGGSDTTPGDARAAYSYNPNLSTPTDAQRSTASDKKSWLRTLASDTGGESLIGRSDLRAELETVARSTSHYYMLGYSPVDTAKAGFRAISVKVKVPGAKVLTRKGYVRQKPWVELTVKEREGQLEDALSSWTDAQDLPIGLSTEFYPTTDRHALAAIDLSVRRGLATVVEGQARLELLMRIERPNGRKVIERRRDVTLTSAESLRDVHYLEQADLKAGVYVLKVAMRDAARGTLGTAHARFRIPDFDKHGPVASTLVLLAPQPSAVLRVAEGAAEAAASFRYDGQEFFPAPERAFPAQGEVLCHYRVSNLAVDETTGLPRLVVSYSLFKGEEMLARYVVHYKIDRPPDEASGVPIHVRLPVGGLVPGEYSLQMLAYDVLAAKGVTSDVAFKVTAP